MSSPDIPIERALDPDKYITFKRSTLLTLLPEHSNTLKMLEVNDAVVILRRDMFAGPALHTYAACIGIVASVLKESDPEKAKELRKIADYFEDQAQMADDDDVTGLPSI